MENMVLERFGGITKEEPLSSVRSDLIAAHSCVLESTTPFFSYYNEVSAAEKPSYLYLVLEGYYSFEWILRATINIKKKIKESFDAAGGNITLYDNVWQVIRIRELRDFSKIGMLQQMYRQEGIQLKTSLRKVNNAMGIIRLRKFFYLQPAGQDIFLDTLRPDLGYFIIPEYLNWESFGQLTEEVKYETSLLFFDAGKAYLLENGSMTYLVRVFRENLTLDRLNLIKSRYLKLIGSKSFI